MPSRRTERQEYAEGPGSSSQERGQVWEFGRGDRGVCDVGVVGHFSLRRGLVFCVSAPLYTSLLAHTHKHSLAMDHPRTTS